MDRTTLDLLREVDDMGVGLTEWEVKFIGDLIDRDVTSFTKDQADKILEIHQARVGDDDFEED